ncbi:MAG: MBL fold metallo-hydrolase [Christensenellales bacterium]
MIFLGTGAAEMVPSPFCDCAVCNRLREEKIPPRRRSSFLLDEENLIDMGPDCLFSCMSYGVLLTSLRRVFITHSHADHMDFTNLTVISMLPAFDHPFEIVLSEAAFRWTNAVMEATRHLRGPYQALSDLLREGRITLRPVTPYVPFAAGEWQVLPVETNHAGNGEDEYAVNYLFSARGRRLLYACDTGLYGEETLAALAGQGIDTLIMEGTNGSRPAKREDAHLNADHYIENVTRLLENRGLRRDAVTYVTHINQGNTFLPCEYQAYMDAHCPVKTVITHDGMVIP